MDVQEKLANLVNGGVLRYQSRRFLKRPNLPARIFAQKKGGKRGCELHPEEVVVDAFARVACTHGGVLVFCYEKWRSFVSNFTYVFFIFDLS